tara:strand:- start:173 stop:508 length:336 start_codon:yes stop_codon:yes gene_type:complete
MGELDKDSEVLQRLYDLIEVRKEGSPEASYTAELLSTGVERVAQKLGEEAVETVIAVTQGKPNLVVYESADLLYHLLVAWALTGVRPEDVWAELAKREGKSGIAEKALRGK